MMNVKETAKQIRKELKEKFPFTKFSVRCERSGSINVSWTDFPTTKAVEEVVSKYEQVDRCEVTGEILSGGNLFIFTRQTWSEEMKNKIDAEVRNNYGESYLKDRVCYYRAFNETAEKLNNTLANESPEDLQTNNDHDTNEVESLQISYKINEEKNGIELYFTEKPSEAIREQLKQYGFKWSRLGFWYAKKTDERLNFVQSLMPDSHNSEQENEPNYPDINIYDIESYVIDKKLSEAENAGHWIFRTKERDHTKEIQNFFASYNNKVLEVLEQTDNERIKYYLKKSLQSFKKRYFENYVKRLRNKANNPSWIVTGRGGLNKRKYDKALNQYDKLMAESIQLMKEIDRAIDRAKDEIRRDKEQQIKEAIKNVNNDLTFTTMTKEIEYMGLKERKRVYMYGDYWTARLWGCFRIFKGNKEIYEMKSTDKLEDAKRYIAYLVQQEKEK